MRAGRRQAQLLAALALALALPAAALTLAAAPARFAAQGRERMLSFAAAKTAPAVARWLATSAERARADGVAPMPAGIRKALSGFLNDDVLDRVRYRIGGGNAVSLQAYTFLHPQTRAITLGGVIVFRDAENAAKPRYWVHEIVHLEQVRRWGLGGLAERYIRDAGAIEAEAWQMTERYVAWALRRDLEAAANPSRALTPLLQFAWQRKGCVRPVDVPFPRDLPSPARDARAGEGRGEGTWLSRYSPAEGALSRRMRRAARCTLAGGPGP